MSYRGHRGGARGHHNNTTNAKKIVIKFLPKETTHGDVRHLLQEWMRDARIKYVKVISAAEKHPDLMMAFVEFEEEVWVERALNIYAQRKSRVGTQIDDDVWTKVCMLHPHFVSPSYLRKGWGLFLGITFSSCGSLCYFLSMFHI